MHAFIYTTYSFESLYISFLKFMKTFNISNIYISILNLTSVLQNCYNEQTNKISENIEYVTTLLANLAG